ncbi:DUF624 domain-containing protein [Candidatus Nomurabacteria bacterium]|nr:DUF624 domain-containing protein [Candidatus Nomurabacteria bacterium]
MEKVVLATGNKKKVEELNALLAGMDYTVVPQSEFNVESVPETGTTFVENAIIKARHAARITGLPAIADDSGIEVDALLGRPGVYSARYAGDDASDQDNLEKLLTETSIAESVSNVSQAVSQSVSSIASSGISGSEEAVVQLTPKETAAILFSQINIVFSFALVGLQLLVLGPVHAGITYIFRNYSREEHAFIWGDFKEHLKKNWKQSLLTSLISFLAVIILSTNFVFYSKGDMVNNTFLKGILTGAVAVIFIVFTMMQMYIYPMMITFKLTLKQLYKNSVLLTMARLPWNIGIMLLSILITTALPIAFLFFGGSLGIILGIFYYFFLAFGLNMMLTNFFVYRQLKKYMIDPMNETKTDTNEIDDEEPIFKDTRTEDEIEDGE